MERRSKRSWIRRQRYNTSRNAVLAYAALLLFMLEVRVTSVIFCSLCLSFPAIASDQPAKRSVPIVVGFVGGMVAHNNAIHSEVQLANRLRRDYAAGLEVKMFENRRGREARLEILHLLDANGDGELSKAEKSDARIAIYGHSWGASETVTLARALGQEGIPVLLTIQVDSVAKPGENDGLIPANVAQAVNFYQRDGLLHGRSEIRADDSSRTRILGNFQLDYKTRSMDLKGYPWYARMFMKPHIEIESDPSVWQRVESLIRSELRPAAEDR